VRQVYLALALLSFGLLSLRPAAAKPPKPKTGQKAPAKDREPELDEVVVEATAEDGSQPAQRRIERREIERSARHDGAQLMELLPGTYAGFGRRGERTFTLLGFEQRQISVLIDGQPANVPYEGQLDLSYLPAHLIERITVVKGPASTFVGPNGMGGAINIVTRRPGSGPLATVTSEAGSAGSWQLTGSHSATFGRFGYTLYGGLKQRDAWPLAGDFQPVSRENGSLRENSDSRFWHVGTALSYRLSSTQRLRASVTFVDGERGVPPSLVAPVARFWRFATWRTLSLSAGHRGRYVGSRLTIDELFFARFYDNLVDSFDDASYTTQRRPNAFSSWFRDRIFGGRVQVGWTLPKLPWGPAALRLWASIQHDRHGSENISSPDGPSARTTQEPTISRSFITMASEAESWIGDQIQLTLGVQLDYEIPGTTAQSELDSRVSVGPLLTVSYFPTPELTLSARAARRTRFPTLKERLSAGVVAEGGIVANPLLGPESSWHFAIDGSYRPRRWLSVSLSLFDAEVDGLINLVPVRDPRDPAQTAEQFQNIDESRLLGLEASLRLRPIKALLLAVSYAGLIADRKRSDDPLAYRPATPQRRASLVAAFMADGGHHRARRWPAPLSRSQYIQVGNA
jgi:iron complex outermembrane receptor protein